MFPYQLIVRTLQGAIARRCWNGLTTGPAELRIRNQWRIKQSFLASSHSTGLESATIGFDE
jgi:hypothetical protein